MALIGASPRPRASSMIGPGGTFAPGSGDGSRIHGFRPAATTAVGLGLEATSGVGVDTSVAVATVVAEAAAVGITSARLTVGVLADSSMVGVAATTGSNVATDRGA